MTFSEKLDFLLTLTNTPNNMLAKHLSLDPSYISRLRRGERSVPHEDYLRMIASFFSKRCSEEYILSALATTMEKPSILTVKDSEEFALLLFQWLESKEETSGSRLETLLSDLSQPSSANASKRQAAEREAAKKDGQDLRMFYGMEGRRQATLALFNLALQQPAPGTLLLFSDENSKWMLDNSSFSQEWSTLLWQLILKGYKIKVIHKVTRDIDEMLDVIHQWLPFYTSGAVEPYYYPRLRDGVYKRTLSVVSGKAAVFATSIGESMETTANFMSTDKLTVDSFTNEFYSYLALCKPLIKIHPAKNIRLVLPELFSFEGRNGSLISRSDAPSLITLPPRVLETFSHTLADQVTEDFLESFSRYSARFEEKLKTDPVFQIIRLAEPEDILAGKVQIGSISTARDMEMFYTTETYIDHLQNILRLLTLYENFNVFIAPDEAVGYSLYCNEENGVMILKEDDPPILFEVTESNMVSAFWDYLNQTIQYRQFHSYARTAAIQQIRELIDALQSGESTIKTREDA